ncbi:MAG: hypothetical protein IJ225_05695 [Solobacterium sp.]|nr:hypothetical protein [Solobacterium sp.]
MSEKKQSFLSQEISFGKKGGKSGRGKYPDKTYINLVQDENKGSNRRAILWFLVFLVFLGIFTKFAVLDQLDKVAQAERQYRLMETQVRAVQEANSEYDAVKAEYDEVTDWYMTEDEKSEVDKSNVFRMLEDDMMPYVGIQSVQIAGNTIAVQTTVTDLQTVSMFLSRLQNDSRNGFVTVTTASANNGKEETKNDVIASVVITYGGTEGGN